MNRRQRRRYARKASRPIPRDVQNRRHQPSSLGQIVRIVAVVIIVGLMIVLVALRPFMRGGPYLHGTHSRWR